VRLRQGGVGGFASLLAGLVFCLGLIVSGMANPAKVLGFLDLGGPWDLSLAFVMGGAVALGMLAFALAGKRAPSYLDAEMRLACTGSAGPAIGKVAEPAPRRIWLRAPVCQIYSF
jgi:uncharacterized membrane protein YedE/YeeE